MFKFHLDYFKNGRGLHLKTVLFTILSSIIMAIFMLIPGIFLIVGGVTMAMSQDIYGNPSGGGMATFFICLVIGIILAVLMYIFVLIPLAYGFLKFYKDTDLGRSPRFKDLFMFLKKGNYVKTLKLTVVMFVISVAIYIAMYVVILIIELIFLGIFGTSVAILQPDSSTNFTNAMSITSIILVLFMALVIFAVLIPIYYLVIFIVNTVFVHVDQSSLPTLNKFSIGWNITSKGPNSAWKLLFSNVLYFIIAYIIMAIFLIIFSLIIAVLPSALQILLGIIVYIILIIFSVGISYFIYGSIINFYHKNKNALYPQNNKPTQEQ
nr:hypothetical protein [Mammaliicoccus sp. Marseille-Q6498]